MHPTTNHWLVQSRAGDLRRRAHDNVLARAARRSRAGQRGHAMAWWPALGRRMRRRPSPRTSRVLPGN